VLELADEKGLYCGKLMADMGADVVKIERPGGDATRDLPPFWRDVPHRERSLPFLYLNTGKRGITLDLARPEGRALFARLARTADVVIETGRPGDLESLGLGYQALAAGNPGLVLTSITGFGQSGPWRDLAAADIVVSALSGAMYVTGAEQDPPVVLAGSQAYVMASTFAAVSTLMALLRRAIDGLGQHVDISAEEAMASVSHICGVGKWLDDGIIPRRRGTGLFASVPSGAYACRDGLVYLMVNRPAHWKALAEWIHEVTGNQEVLDPMFEGPSSNRLPYRELLDVFITEFTAGFTVQEIYHQGQGRHIALTPVSDAAALARDPHLAARGYFVKVELDEEGALRYPGAPYRHSATPWRIRAAPRVGQHNHEIYGEELGLGADELRQLTEQGVI